jgi:GDP-mannose 6-dehydrogenase
MPGAKVLLVGLAFKTNSDDLRESPNLDLARRLIQLGFHLSVYDPVIEPTSMMGNNLGYTYSQLPNIGEILISKEVAESRTFDLVINANGLAGALSLKSSAIFDIDALR